MSSIQNPTLGAEPLIEGNPRYNIIPQGTFILQNCAEGVEHITKPSNGYSANQLDFSLHVNDRFLERSVNLQIKEIPLIIERAFPITFPAYQSTVTTDNYISTFFEKYQHITLSEFGFLNAIEFLTINLDGKSITLQNPGETLRALSQYYDRSELHKYFPASTSDIFYNHDLYRGESVVSDNKEGVLKTLSGGKLDIQVKRPVFNEADPYSSGGLDNTSANRTPTMKFTQWLASDPLKISCSLVDVSIPLPLSLFTIGADDLPIYNCDRLDVKIIFKSEWVKYLFNVRNTSASRNPTTGIVTPGDIVYKDINFDNIRLNTFISELSYRSYTPPEYIAKQVDPNQPYYMNYPLIELAATVNDRPLLALRSEATHISIPNLKAIPKQILIYAKPKYNNGLEFTKSANYYARIDDLQVKLNGVSTPINTGNGLTLFDLCKKEGLNLTKEIAMYSKGYAVLLNVSNSLSCKTNTLIGAMDGVKNLDISLTLTNLNAVDAYTDYEIKVVCIYDAIFAYKHNGGVKFEIIESIVANDYRSTALHANMLYDRTIKGMNMLGGSFWSVLGDFGKKIGTGIKNVVTGVIQNRNGFRDNLVNAWNGAGSMDNNFPINGGAVIHNSNNRVGGKSVDSWSVRK